MQMKKKVVKEIDESRPAWYNGTKEVLRKMREKFKFEHIKEGDSESTGSDRSTSLSDRTMYKIVNIIGGGFPLEDDKLDESVNPTADQTPKLSPVKKMRKAKRI